MKFLSLVDRIIHVFETLFLSLGLSAMAGVLFVQVLLGYYGKSLPWAGEMASYLMVWVTCIGAGAATRNGQHIAIEVFSSKLKGVPRRILEIVVGLLCIGTCVLACIVGIDYVLSTWELGQVTVSLKIPLWIIYSALPVTAGLIAVRFALRLVLPHEEDRETGDAA